MKSKQQIVFAIGTGRCGTKFLSKVLQQESTVASCHERHPLSDTFHRFCKWYGLQVDHGGFLQTKQESIDEDLKVHQISFESSAYLSLSVEELYEKFNAKFILLVRRPDKVVNSYIRKGWYNNPIHITESDKIPSFQRNDQFHHFLGRTLPKGSEFERWKDMTRVGKLSWYWNTLNKEVIRQFKNISSENFIALRLEDLDYRCYRHLSEFIGFKTVHSEKSYSHIVQSKPNAFATTPPLSSWNEKAFNEFESEVQEMANYFSYPFEKRYLLE